MASYDSRFAHLLALKLADDLTDAHNALGNGSQIIREDAAATGMACANCIGKIQGLKLALARIQDVEDELAGKPRQQQQNQREES